MKKLHVEVGHNKPRIHHPSLSYRRWMGGVVTFVCATVLVVLSAAPVQAMPARGSAAGHRFASVQVQEQQAQQSDELLASPGGTLNLTWQPGSLQADVNLSGLAANTMTQGFIVPGTCSNPGGIATFRTSSVSTDGNVTCRVRRLWLQCRLASSSLRRSRWCRTGRSCSAVTPRRIRTPGQGAHRARHPSP